MTAYAWFELKRLLRSPGMLVYTVVMPVASYAVFTVGTGRDLVNGLPADASIMIGLAGYGALTGVLSLSSDVSSERTYGWLRQLRVTPLASWQVVVVKIFVCTPIAIPSVLAVGAAGYLEHGVRIEPGRWAFMLIALWLGTIPFSLLGLAMGYALKPSHAQSASFLTFFTLSALGGLFVPTTVFPAPMRTLAYALPSNRYADLGWRPAAGHPPNPAGAVILAAWTLVFCLLAMLAYRRSARTR